MNDKTIVNIDGRDIQAEGEKSLLELIRKANINLPTFCYHSELSVYGACRLCLVEIEGRGIQPSCSTPCENGMKIKTNTGKIREIRKIIVELLLAGGDHDCTTCPKSGKCRLQDLAVKLGIKNIRYKKEKPDKACDISNSSIVRDPDKCVLCGDCVRVCSEIQGVGAIGFAYRGKEASVMPAFGRKMNEINCVFCGQCARVCPTGSITIRSDVSNVWEKIFDEDKVVVAQIAPAVRTALGEEFGAEPGRITTGQIVASLKRMGFDMVFDTSFAADMTVIEEGDELLNRIINNENLPLFTSCCPAWVKYAESEYPELMPNLSTCRSPQAMFGSIAKKLLPRRLGIKKEKIIVVSIMPCTAKKYEASRKEFYDGINPDVDYVLTTQELARMINETGMDFNALEPESFDMPFGFKTGAGVIFGNTGGVTEAVLRYVLDKTAGGGTFNYEYEFKYARDNDGVKEIVKTVGGRELKIAVASGLKNAKKIIEEVKCGKKIFDFIEVMACPGGCIGGAGQPFYKDKNVRDKRAKGLYDNDKMLQLHKSQENPYLNEIKKEIKENSGCGEDCIHQALHTYFDDKKTYFVKK